MTYIISCPSTKQTIILDSVLDYNAASGRTSNTHNEAVVQYCEAGGLDVRYILESHVHGEIAAVAVVVVVQFGMKAASFSIACD